MAHSLRSFLAPTSSKQSYHDNHNNNIIPFSLSFNTISDISNIFKGSGIRLLAAIVFNNPGNNVVRATYRNICYHDNNNTSSLEIQML